MQTPGELQKLWRGSQAQMHSSGTLSQPGGWTLPALFDLPLALPGDPVDPGWQAEPQIETFLIDTESAIAEPTGTGPAVAWWQAAVERFASAVHGALRTAGVTLIGPATVTASVANADEVNAEPHMDDAQYQPGMGVGVVAIAGTGAGPRALVGSIPLPPGGDLGHLAPEIVARFAESNPSAAGNYRLEKYPANRITLFTRFGQVHAGPGPAELLGNEVYRRRSLLVYRSSTEPQ